VDLERHAIRVGAFHVSYVKSMQAKEGEAGGKRGDGGERERERECVCVCVCVCGVAP